MKINKKLLPMKGHYFLLNAGSAPMAPFIPTIVREMGFSAFVVGSIYTVVPLLTVLCKPLLGGIADKFQCQKGLFLCLLAVQGTFFFIIQFMPHLPSSVELSCANNTYLSLYPRETETKNYQQLHDSSIYCQLSCENSSGIDFTSNYSRESKPYLPTLLEFNKTILSSDERYCKEGLLSMDNFEESSGLLRLKVNLLANRGSDWYEPYCDKTTISTCKVICDNDLINQIIKSPPVADSDVVYYYQFWLILLIIAIAKIATTALFSIGDAICFNLLGDKKTDFGLQMLWGAAGWGLMSAFSGLVVDKLSEGRLEKNYSAGFLMGAVILILDLMVSFKLEYENEVLPPKSIIKDLMKVLNKGHIWIFMFWCVLNGIYTALIWNFLFWFLEDVAAHNDFDMTYIKTLQGLTLTVHCYLGEIPFFFFSSWILRKIGHQKAMILVLLAVALRFIVYSYLTNPWWTLPNETLNGLTFGIYYSTMATYASSFAPPGTESTVQTLVCALFDGLGVSIGSFIGGYMMQELGGTETFWRLGLSALGFSVLLIAIQFFMKEEKLQTSKPVSAPSLEIPTSEKTKDECELFLGPKFMNPL